MTVHDPLAARALSDPEVRRVLAPFIGVERTVKDVARELGWKLNPLLLRVRRLVKLGLLIVTREAPRAGRAVKHYRSAADGFFVPYTVTNFETPEAWLLADYASRERDLARATMRAGAAWGLSRGQASFGKRLFRREDGLMEADFAFGVTEPADLLEDDAPAVLSTFVVTNLDRETAKALQRELAEVVRRYERAGPGGPYLLRLGLAPTGSV
jgi:hypothetical protein